jgi:negative regulator of sigma E activity
LKRIGTANAFTRQLGNRQLTVIGEVPAATVRAIGDAFRAPPSGR